MTAEGASCTLCVMHVKSLIAKLGTSDAEIADALGVHRTTVSRIRRDQIEVPRKVMVRLLQIQLRLRGKR